MVNWILSKYIKHTSDANEIRGIVGKISGIIGIGFNVFLFVIKFGLGTIVHSISIQADGINNLTDAASNVLSIISFYIANKPADRNHPYGHQRTEILASFLMALIIGVLGMEIAKESVIKIVHPAALDFRSITIVILVISIVVKLYMYSYNLRLSKRYGSTLLHAVAIDAISDVWGTSAVLVAALISALTGFNLDGFMGVAVSVLILYNAAKILKETADELIGQAPDPDLIYKLKNRIRSHDIVLDVHDVMLHDYGPGQQFASAHVEVDAQEDILQTHDEIDNIEKEVQKQMGIELVLHTDPIVLHDPTTELYRKKVEKALIKINKGWSFHDFRIVKGPTHINLVFDVVVPFEEKWSENEIKAFIQEHIDTDETIYLVITVDHPFA